jgi:hypothetical protein
MNSTPNLQGRMNHLSAIRAEDRTRVEIFPQAGEDALASGRHWPRELRHDITAPIPSSNAAVGICADSWWPCGPGRHSATAAGPPSGAANIRFACRHAGAPAKLFPGDCHRPLGSALPEWMKAISN